MAKARQYNTKSLYFSPRTTQALGGIFNYPLTLVEAPMGYGKTTAVREYLNKTAANVLWQLVYDDSPSGFWITFSRLFAKIHKDASESLLKLGFPLDSILLQETLRIFDEIEMPDKTVLVIDDYHLIESPAVKQLFEFLALSGIANLHIVLIARFTELKNREDLLLKGYLHLIKKEIFELNPQDLAAYYKTCGISLKAAEATELSVLTEGWISALYLFMLEFIATGSYSLERNIYKLIEKAIYEPLSAETKDFLLNMCIFDTFTKEQAVHIWGKENTGKLLAEVIRKNAFVKFDAGSKSYYVHNLFTGFLKEVLKEKGGSYRQELYKKAAEWLQRTGDYFTARRYYYECGDFDNLLLALEEDQAYDFSAMQRALLKQYMSECPPEVKARHHFALLKYAVLLFVHNETALFGQTCQEFVSNIRADGNLSPEIRNQLLGEFEFLLGFSVFNDLKKMAAHYQRSWELLGRPASVFDTNINWTFGSPSVLSLYYRESGKLAEHVRDLQEHLPGYVRLMGGHGSGGEHIMEAEWYFNMGDFENAEIATYKALYQARQAEQPNIEFCALFLEIRLAFMKSNSERVFELLDKMREEMTKKNNYQLIHMVEICEGSVYAYLGKKDKIPEGLLVSDMRTLRLGVPAFSALNILLGRILLISGEYLRILGSTEHYMGMASIFPNLLGQVYTFIYQAAASKQLFKDAEALTALKKALDIALPDKLYMPFVENCDYIKPLLEKIYIEGDCREGIPKILALYAIYEKAAAQIVREQYSGEKPKLTEREQEIAHLAAEGITNKEIGAKLFISENTVKVALKSVFEKLGVNSRTLLKQNLSIAKK